MFNLFVCSYIHQYSERKFNLVFRAIDINQDEKIGLSELNSLLFPDGFHDNDNNDNNNNGIDSTNDSNNHNNLSSLAESSRKNAIDTLNEESKGVEYQNVEHV